MIATITLQQEAPRSHFQCVKHCQQKGQSSLRYLAAALLPGQDLAAQGIEPEAV